MDPKNVVKLRVLIDKTQQNTQDDEKPKLSVKKASLAAACVLAVMICIIFAVKWLNRNRLDPSGYIKLSYFGANGYAGAECSVDKEKLYRALAGREKNMDKLTAYRNLAESFEAAVQERDISNGDRIEVSVSYDAQAAKAAGIVVTKDRYTVKAAGIGNGEQIDLFSKVDIVFAGISPEAYMVIENNWDEEYLKNLEFTADKPVGIAAGDTVVISCSADQSELARHGYIVSETSVQLAADRLSSYVENAGQLDGSLLEKIKLEAVGAVEEQTEDRSFRMLYRATGDQEYLYTLNDEHAENIELVSSVFLTRKDKEGSGEANYLYLVCRADVSNDEESIEVFFIFEYSQAFLTTDGQCDIAHDEPEKRYTCGTDYDSLYASAIGEKEEAYDVHVLE